MSRSQVYQKAKKLARKLGIDESDISRLYRNNTTLFWEGKVRELKQRLVTQRLSGITIQPPRVRRTVVNRNQLYRKAKTLARKLGINERDITSLYRDNNTLFWEGKVRDLNQRVASQELTESKLRTTTRTQLFGTELKTIIRNREIEKLIRGNRFQQILNDVIDNKTLSEAQAIRVWNKIVGSGRYNIEFTFSNSNQFIAVNNNTREYIIEILTQGVLLEFEREIWGSDVLDRIQVRDITGITISRLAPARIIGNRNARFFPYVNTTDLDLMKYQIFNKEDASNQKIVDAREQCLLHSFLMAGVSDAFVNSIKLSYIKGVSIKKSDLYAIAFDIRKDIVLHSMNGDRVNKKLYASKTNNGKIDIAIHSNHYFLFEETKYSKFSINSFDELNKIKDFHKIVGKQVIKGKTYYKKSNKSKINSLLLIDKLSKANKFKQLDLSLFAESSSTRELEDVVYLDNIDIEQRLSEPKTKNLFETEGESDDIDYKALGNKIYKKYIEEEEKEEKEEWNDKLLDKVHAEQSRKFEKRLGVGIKPKIFYADIETYVRGEKHELQLLGVTSDVNDWVEIYNICDPFFSYNDKVDAEQLLIYEFLGNVTSGGTNNALVYFHNVKYDFTVLEKSLDVISKTQKDNQLYSIKIRYKSQIVELRDSYKMLPFALSKFGSEFNLESQFRKKEAISYEYYTRGNNDERIPTKAYAKTLSKNDKVIFAEVVTKCESYDPINKTFNPLTYYKEYLRLDCLVLKKGIQKFNKLIEEITENKMNIYNHLTISSLTDCYMMEEGAYEGIYEVKGNLRAYIAKAVYGGRVCVNTKYKKRIIEGKLADYDGVSLYPSAINRLCREKGLSKGVAKRLINKENWEDYHYAIMTVKITAVNKKQQMPFIAYKTDSAIDYINTPPPGEIIIDSTCLQDYIKFHQIEYEIIDGVYWDSGGNNKMGEVIKRLFDARLHYKQTNKALANTIKLMLNSTYGKTITKKTKTKKEIVKTTNKVKDKETGKWHTNELTKFEDFVYNNFQTIKSYRKINTGAYEVESICSDRSYNRGHIGCSILSYSKRIMNEVFDVANTEKCKIYYTDTDSLHCDLKDVTKINLAYWFAYKKQLTGIQLEQFHTDFDLEGAKSEIYAIKSIFLGKKSYIDILESTDKNGKTITGHHIRLKGITKEGLEDQAKKYNNSYFNLYTDLAKGKEVSFTLNPVNKEENSKKVLFEFANGAVKTRSKFVRKVTF